jgi:tryptophanyl-tRNA synthetase
LKYAPKNATAVSEYRTKNIFAKFTVNAPNAFITNEGKDGVNNLMAIYSAVTGLSYEQIEKDFDGKGYGDFKTAVGEAVVEELRPIRERYEKLVADKAYLESCYRKADEIALKISSRTMGKVMKKIGFI